MCVYRVCNWTLKLFLIRKTFYSSQRMKVLRNTTIFFKCRIYKIRNMIKTHDSECHAFDSELRQNPTRLTFSTKQFILDTLLCHVTIADWHKSCGSIRGLIAKQIYTFMVASRYQLRSFLWIIQAWSRADSTEFIDYLLSYIPIIHHFRPVLKGVVKIYCFVFFFPM